MPASDFLLFDHGSFLRLKPGSKSARQWCEARLDDEALVFGGAYCIEPRFMGPIYEGICDDGLSIEGVA